MAEERTSAGKKAGIVAALTLAALPFIYKREGTRLEAYPDSGGVWTVCSGVTHIPGVGPVKQGMKFSLEQCKDLDRAVVGGFSRQVVDALAVELPEQTAIAHVTFAYNIGIAGYRGSIALRKTNAGDLAGGCRAMMNWYTSGGLDCRKPENRKWCGGFMSRRTDEMNQCLEGLQ